MSRLTKWRVVLWIVVLLAQAGCRSPAVVMVESVPTLTVVPAVAAPQSESTPEPPLRLATPTALLFPSPRPTDTSAVPPPSGTAVADPTYVRKTIVLAEDASWYHYWRPSTRRVRIYDLAVDGEWLWIATSQGLMRVSQYTLVYERFSRIGDSSGVSLENMTRLTVDDEGRLWAGGLDGLIRYDDDSGWTVITTMTAHNFALDAEDNIWLFLPSRFNTINLRFSGLEPPSNGDWEPETVKDHPHWSSCENWRFLATSWHECSSQAEYSSPSDRCKTCCDVYGNDWSIKSYAPYIFSLFDFPVSLIRCDGEVVSAVPRYECTLSAIVAAGVKDGVWIGLDQRLFYGANGTVWEYRVAAGELVSEPDVRAFAFTSDGRVWVSTLDGLLRLDEERKVWQPVAVGETISVGEGAPIVADDRGNLWLLGDDSLARFDGRVWQHWGLPETVQGCDLRSGSIGEFRGQVWVAFGACGLWHFDGRAWDKSSLDAKVAMLIPGLDGRLYAVTDHGFVYVYDGARWVEYFVREIADGLENSRPVIAVYSDGGIRRAWVGGEGSARLWHYTPGEMWDDPLRLPPDFIVTSLLVDSQDNLWVGGPLGLLRCEEQACQFLHFAHYDYLSDPSVNVLAQDQQGRIWVGGQGWLSVYDPAVERD